MEINKMTVLSLAFIEHVWKLLGPQQTEDCVQAQGEVTNVSLLTTSLFYMSIRFEMPRQIQILISAYMLDVVNSSNSDVLPSSSSSSLPS